MFALDQVVPWGRSLEEYRAMFAMSDADFQGRILGCGDGPAGFNAGATALGARVVSCDPIFQWSADELRARIGETYLTIMEQIRQNMGAFVWESIPSVEELGRVRMAAMEEFLADYPDGLAHGRYVRAELPALPFADGAFDLAVCSHLLFLYSKKLGAAFHRDALLELGRVAKETRVFPLLALDGEPSPFIDDCVAMLRETGHEVSIEQVPYEFQRGANRMLRFRKRAASA